MKIRIAIVLAAVIAGFGVASCIKTPGGRGLFVPRMVPVIVTNADGRRVTNYQTVYDVNPGFTNALGTAQQLTTGTPWDFVTKTVLGGVAAVATWIAKRKSDQAAVVPVLMAGLDKATNTEEVNTEMYRRANETGMERKFKKVIRLHQARQIRKHLGK